MGFQGDLKQGISLTDIFQNLAGNRATGTFRVWWRDVERFIRFEEGTISAFSHGVRKSVDVIAHLGKRGYVDPDRLRRVVGGDKGGERSALRAVQAKGLIDKDDLEAAVSELITEQVYDLMTLTEAEFEFTEGDPPARVFPQDHRALNLRLDPQPMLFEGARRADEWLRIREVIGSDRDIFVLLAGWEDQCPDGMPAEVANLLDGVLDVAGVKEQMPASSFDVMKAVSDLVRSGCARPATAEEMEASAQDALADSDTEGAARLLRHALDLHHNNEPLRTQLAKILHDNGDAAGAAAEYAHLGYAAMQRGDKDGALHHYAFAIRLDPSDVALREHHLKLLRDHGSRSDLGHAGVELADKLADIGLAERGRDVLRSLIDADVPGPEIRERIAELEVSLGRANEAARVLRELAEAELDQGQEPTALGHMERALELTPDDSDLADRVEDVRSGHHARRRRRLRLFVSIGSAASLLLGLCTVGVAEMVAARGLAGALEHSVTAESRTHPAALSAVTELQELHSGLGWTPSGSHAAILLRRLVHRHLLDARQLTEAGDYEKADRVLAELERCALAGPLGTECEELRSQVELERAAHRALTATHAPDFSLLDAEQALAKIDRPELLGFLLRQLPQQHEPKPLLLVLTALGNRKSPRVIPAVACAFPTTSDADCAALMRVILSTAQRPDADKRAEWDAAIAELEEALKDPVRRVRAREALALLRGNAPRD